MDRAVQKFRHTLGPRIDALEMARYALERNDPGALEAVQRQVQSLRVTIPSCDFTTIFDAVLAAEQAAAEELPIKLSQLLDVLRGEMAAPTQTLYPILLVGSDPDFLDRLEAELEVYGHEVVRAATGAAVLRLVAERRIRLVVIQGDEHGGPNSGLTLSLRTNPSSSAVHIVVIQDAEGLPPPPGLQLRVDADQCLARPIDPRVVARYLHARLSGRGVLFAAGHGGENEENLLEKQAFIATCARLREEALSGSMPSVLGVVSVGEDCDWGRVPDSDAARSVIYKRIGQMLCATFRKTDRVTRWDNATFAVLLPGEELPGGKCALEKALTVLRLRSPFFFRGCEIHLHAAAGMAPVDGGGDAGETLELARQNMAVSRKRGSHQVELPPNLPATTYRRKVMVMADEPCRQVIRQLVEKEGFQVIMADPGHAAAGNGPYSFRYSLVILDDDYAGGRGFEFLSYLRSSGQFSRTPILLLAKNREEEHKAMDVGANATLLKPYSAESFLSHVRRIMHRGRASGAQQPTILLVDSDVPALVSAGTVLCRHGGFRILLARTGWAGIRRMHAEPVDAVIFSMDVTDIARDDLLRLLPQQLSHQRETRVILVTRNPASLANSALHESWIRGVLVKPYKLQNFVADVAGTLDFYPKRETDPEYERLLQGEISRVLRVDS